jgi:hypothetical protein
MEALLTIVYLPEKRADTYGYKSPIGQVCLRNATTSPPPRRRTDMYITERGLLTTVNKLLTITRRTFSKFDMSLNHLPLEILGLILASIYPDEWNHYGGLEVLNLRAVCRKYS